jgi:hypothetical protein
MVELKTWRKGPSSSGSIKSSTAGFSEFAPASEWDDISVGGDRLEVGHDLSLFADFPVPALPEKLSLPVSRWVGGEGVTGGAVLGRSFEKALAAFFEREGPGAMLFKEWGAYRDVPLEYCHGDDWERLLRHGLRLAGDHHRDQRHRGND